MKRVNDGFKIIIYTIFGLVFVISIYLIIINIRHYKALSYEIVVSEADTNYKSFKNNVNEIENKLNNYYNDKKITSLKETLNVLKNGGVFRLMPNTKITYYDMYVLNDYFINNIINDMWMANLKNDSNDNNEIIDVLVNNSNYLNNHFINNGLTLYDSYNEVSIQNDYEMIVNNYLLFSKVVLSILNN